MKKRRRVERRTRKLVSRLRRCLAQLDRWLEGLEQRKSPLCRGYLECELMRKAQPINPADLGGVPVLKTENDPCA